MLPVKSNTVEQGCIPVSSNYVVWQGPNIPCINLCTGDTVSSVVYKVANDLCAIKSSLDLSNLDMSCLLEFCSSVGPAPTTKTLSTVLDFIVKKVCCLNDALEAGLGEEVTPVEDLPLTLPLCLQSNGVTTLAHKAFTLHLANQFCSLKTIVTNMSSHETRITALENTPGISLPTVTPRCILPATATAMNIVLDELEEQYCLLRNVLGTNGQITAATAQQCIGLNNANAFSQPGTMSGYPGWNLTVSSMAQAFQNLWITVCDMRAAMASLKDCCGQADCSQFILNYEASTNSDRTVVTLDFNPGTLIPAGFASGVGGSTIVISDGFSTKSFSDINLVTLAQSGVFTATVAGDNATGVRLNTSQPYTVIVTGNITKDGKSCSKTLNKTVSVPCPIISNVTATLQS